MATPVSQMLGKIYKEYSCSNKAVYELSSRGAFVRFLKKENINLTLSEYFDNVQPGQYLREILCQNVEELTFEDELFDVCTSLEVFEHVENDDQGFKEIYRVLKKGGVFIFTVPINIEENTIERTSIENGKRKNILPPEYHSDSIRGSQKVFCYRNYGIDIVERLHNAGFKKAKIIQAPDQVLWGFARPVIIALK